MSKLSAVAVASEDERLMSGPPWLSTIRTITLAIHPVYKQMIVSTPDRHIGDGNVVRWIVGTIPGYKVVIGLGSSASPASLSQASGSTKVEGNILTTTGSSVSLTYSVSLEDAGGNSHPLDRVSSFSSTPSILSAPSLMIDRMGNPPPNDV